MDALTLTRANPNMRPLSQGDCGPTTSYAPSTIDVKPKVSQIAAPTTIEVHMRPQRDAIVIRTGVSSSNMTSMKSESACSTIAAISAAE